MSPSAEGVGTPTQATTEASTGHAVPSEGATRSRDRLAAVEKKWAGRWDEMGLYRSEPDPGRPKYFATYPYSYMNAFAHVGHAYTMGRVDFMVRYQRLKGRNTLFPFGFHITGTPIVAAAARVAKGDETQLRILEQSGIDPAEIPKFADPQYWVEYFPDQWKHDIGRLGLAIDWRRSFLTTDKNPYYDAFIRWQFARLKEGGFVQKGRHPVIFDPVEEQVIGDHDRAEGEGVAPQEGVLLMFPIQGEAGQRDGKQRHLVAATLRPETVFGQTNLWVDPEVEYVEVEAKEGTWVVSVEAAAKMRMQDLGLGDEVDRVPGADLIGRTVIAPGVDREIPVLPASFMKTDKWTGIVTSVPSDAPLDLVALRDLKEDPAPYTDHGGDVTLLERVDPIEIIRTEGLGTNPAATVVDKLGIKSQSEDVKLKTATEEVYADAFYKGTMLDHCGPVAGQPVAEAKETVKQWLVSERKAHLMWEPESRVVSRHGNEAVVKVVSDQWFVAYGDKDWKEIVHHALDQMTILPEVARKQFHIVVDWLKDWACARETGLGTKLPWDEKWVIESLSDSTVYMAYYTVHHHLERLAPPASDLTPAFWDYVLRSEGNPDEVATDAIPIDAVQAMHDEFHYWYPLDFRNSGKDLLQNHLTFAVFNHCALFPEKHWMQGIGVNGWITVDGDKMSKSKGNFITVRQALGDFGVSETRFALASAGEGLDDANFERDVAAAATRRLAGWLDTMVGTWNAAEASGHEGGRGTDAWFRSVLHRTVRDVDDQMRRAEFKSALKTSYHDLTREWNWYLKRTGDTPAADLAKEYVAAQTRLMAVYVPHLAEEVWEATGHEGSVVDAGFPDADPDAIDPDAERQEKYVAGVLDDIKNILKIIDTEASKILLYTTPQWKNQVEEKVVDLVEALDEGQRPNPGEAIKACMADPELKKHGKAIPQFVNQVLKSGAGFLTERAARAGIDEQAVLAEAQDFLARQFGADVKVYAADDDDKEDPAGKSKAAAPGRPAVYVA